MFFFIFDQPPYAAIIGDIVDSKHITDRRQVQQKLIAALDEINHSYREDIASRFSITLGDEFQGLLRHGSAVVDVIEKIEQEMQPVRIRFGIGVGAIETDINPSLPLGADGPAYYYAREMISELKSIDRKKMGRKTNAMIKIEQHDTISELINTVFALNTVLKSRWTPRQREIIKTYLRRQGTQQEAADALSITQSTVQRALESANFYTYQKATRAITQLLTSIKENAGV